MSDSDFFNYEIMDVTETHWVVIEENTKTGLFGLIKTNKETGKVTRIAETDYVDLETISYIWWSENKGSR